MKGFSVFLLVVACGVCRVSGEANYNNSNTKTEYSQLDKARIVADYLYNHEEVFRQLEKIFSSFQDFKRTLPKGKGGFDFQDFILQRMPYLFESPDFQDIMGIVVDEVNRVDLSGVGKLIAQNHWKKDGANATNALLYTYEHEINFKRMIQRILARRSARDFFPYDPRVMNNSQCYDDTMDFMDSLIGSRYNLTGPEELNFTSYMWALKMFDSLGKPSGGVTKGALYYIGSYDICTKVKAYIPADIYLANRWREKENSFSTKFCRAEFNISDSFVESMNVDTRGVTIKLNWGICVPATCTSDDIANIFTMGVVKVPVNRVSCMQKPELENDSSAIVAIVILCSFGCLVALATFAEGIITSLPISRRQYLNRVGKINNGFVSDEKYIIKNGYAPGSFQMKSVSEGVYNKLSTPTEENHHEKLSNGQASPQNSDSLEKNDYKKLENNEVEINKVAPVVIEQDPKQKEPVPEVVNPDDYRKASPLIKAFSLLTNIPKILNGKKSPSSINCIHGLRFVSMLWIILGHTYNYGIVSQSASPSTMNLIDAAELFTRFTFQGIMAAGFAVDTFFLLSAFLVSYLTLKDLRRQKVKGGYMFMFYFHRFWRLTPLYMIVLMAFSCLYKYMGDGPLWPVAIKAADYCKTNWWTNLLYVNNLVRTHEQCLGWSWYLANDMQFYIISPIFIFTLYWYAPVGIALTVGMGLAGVASAFYEEYVTGGDMFTMKVIPDYWQDVYIVPWTRMAAYMVGILLGWIMYKTDNMKRLSAVKATIGWCITLIVGVFISYITYSYRKEDSEEWPRWLLSLYESTTRPIFAACVGWVIFACHRNRGGLINSVLSWSGIIPLSRLTYACYLVHPTVMMLKIYSQRSLIYIRDYDVAYLYMGHTCMTFMIAFIFSVTFEAPFLSLEKILFHR